jgi:hypothetical protein
MGVRAYGLQDRRHTPPRSFRSGRLIGEDVWEYDDSVREIIPLDSADVLTAEESGKLLAPLIKPLPTDNPFIVSAVV